MLKCTCDGTNMLTCPHHSHEWEQAPPQIYRLTQPPKRLGHTYGKLHLTNQGLEHPQAQPILIYYGTHGTQAQLHDGQTLTGTLHPYHQNQQNRIFTPTTQILKHRYIARKEHYEHSVTLYNKTTPPKP